ncbi:MAG: glycosyltransferase family 4 protein [Desulfobacteraceae bacterium]|nr:glycosyltransferase family 4 protein [Desulfobacteraceae bacterium]
MRVGIVGIKGVPGRHGVESVVDSLVPHLASLGHEVTVYGYSSYTEASDDYRGVRIRTVDGASSKSFEMISHMWNAALESRKQRFDVVHIHNADACLLGWLPQPRFGLIATSHGQAYLRDKWNCFAKSMSKFAERFFVHLPDAITSVSKPLAEYYEKRYGRKTLYIPNGVTLRKTPKAGPLDKWGLQSGDYLFCSAGRIERTKGLHTLLDAYRILGTDLPLVIAGGGAGTDPDYFQALRGRQVPNVKFVGFLTGDELYALYGHARIFVFPSEYEAMSMALLEGLSFGVPTVYSAIPENEVVANGLGFPFAVSDAKSLSDTLRYVLENGEAAMERGLKAKEFVSENHDWASIAARYNEVYLSTCDFRKWTERHIFINDTKLRSR